MHSPESEQKGTFASKTIGPANLWLQIRIVKPCRRESRLDCHLFLSVHQVTRLSFEKRPYACKPNQPGPSLSLHLNPHFPSPKHSLNKRQSTNQVMEPLALISCHLPILIHRSLILHLHSPGQGRSVVSGLIVMFFSARSVTHFERDACVLFSIGPCMRGPRLIKPSATRSQIDALQRKGSGDGCVAKS